ncbi:exodeoxyribonuclease VII large subunit [Dehalococcoidia bacterium]|nr:exodeoxyribonuclease VII large subunit [Dehalococcoidia bacterium]
MAVYTVSDLTTYVKASLDQDAILSSLWVSGEVSNWSRSSVGNIYFTLKDVKSQIRCVMFRPEKGANLGKNGDAAVIHGRLSMYTARGEIQIYVDLIRPQGTGLLYLELEQLKAKLFAEGLFEENRKRPLPPLPKRIGVVTSPAGAVFSDICNVIERRYPLAELILSPSLVQGDGAPTEIISALHALNAIDDIDVIIVARGGGSIEELWPFNNEMVARAIYASQTPVVSGVGHETDLTISDLVADHRAPTPSAAGEIVVPDIRDLKANLINKQQNIIGAINNLIAEHQQHLDISLQHMNLDKIKIPFWQHQVDSLIQTLLRTLTTRVSLSRERLTGLHQNLDALDPMAVLSRGYALLQRADDGTPICTVNQVKNGTKMEITVHDGKFNAQVVI